MNLETRLVLLFSAVYRCSDSTFRSLSQSLTLAIPKAFNRSAPNRMLSSISGPSSLRRSQTKSPNLVRKKLQTLLGEALRLSLVSRTKSGQGALKTSILKQIHSYAVE